MLARVHQSLGAHDAARVEQHGVRQLADLPCHPERGETARTGSASSRSARTKASCSGRGPSLASTISSRSALAARDGAQRPAAASCRRGRWATGRTAACSARRRARRRSRGRVLAVLHLDDRRRLADLRPASLDQRAGGRDPLVEHADLPRERHHDAREHHDGDPQHERSRRSAPASRRLPQAGEPGCERQEVIRRAPAGGEHRGARRRR